MIFQIQMLEGRQRISQLSGNPQYFLKTFINSISRANITSPTFHYSVIMCKHYYNAVVLKGLDKETMEEFFFLFDSLGLPGLEIKQLDNYSLIVTPQF